MVKNAASVVEPPLGTRYEVSGGAMLLHKAGTGGRLWCFWPVGACSASTTGTCTTSSRSSPRA